ncbi:MAG: hypothetical protein HQ581_06930 [Planctomycetes bacterium]|nr:hypothetical protein [Planctomycetota bacterium]
MTKRFQSLIALITLHILFLPVRPLVTSVTEACAQESQAEAPQASSPIHAAEYDAALVGMSVPKKVTAGEVFAATISMRNTGTKAWGGWPIRLRSVNPQDNLSWGTNYILIAQGTSVRPGEEYTFRSNLRAPANPGKINFQWQVCKDGTTWLGETTPGRIVEVVAGPAEAGATLAPATRTSDGKRVLALDDFEYLGSFKAPKTVGDARGAFSESGLALRPMADGRDRLLMNYTHPTQMLFEIEIPALVKVEDGEHAGLETAEVRKIWGPLKVVKPGQQAIGPNGGFTWFEETRTLFWTSYHGYKTGNAPPVLAATTLSDDGQVTHGGPWYISAPDGLYKSYWGGVIGLPETFADMYTDGKRLALGFGGYYSICGSASRGPALGTIPHPDPKQTSLPVTALLYHPHDSPSPRDGNYFNANCGFWSDQPDGPDKGTWTYDDWCRAGTFIDTPAAHGYVAFVRLGTGRLGYDFGAITSAGTSQYWYFYDPKQLGEAARGQKQPWQTTPSSTARVNYPLGRTVTGACFDARTRRLFLCVTWAYPEGKESYPVVHVYKAR